MAHTAQTYPRSLGVPYLPACLRSRNRTKLGVCRPVCNICYNGKHFHMSSYVEEHNIHPVRRHVLLSMGPPRYVRSMTTDALLAVHKIEGGHSAGSRASAMGRIVDGSISVAAPAFWMFCRSPTHLALPSEPEAHCLGLISPISVLESRLNAAFPETQALERSRGIESEHAASQESR